MPGRSTGSRSSSAERMSRMSISMCENEGVPSVMTMSSARAASLDAVGELQPARAR